MVFDRVESMRKPSPREGGDSGKQPTTPSGGLLGSMGNIFKSSSKSKAHHHVDLGQHKAVLIGVNY
jgi:hypothetical protein